MAISLPSFLDIKYCVDETIPNISPMICSLHHYTPSGKLPPTARIDPKLPLANRQPLNIWDMWKIGAVVVQKMTEVTADVIAYHVRGPRRKSWGLQMTIISSMLRNAGQYSALVDIGAFRFLWNIRSFVPLPLDVIVTPVTFRVKQRKLRGLLAPYDAEETGSRALSGEWVVGKKTWKRLQSDWKAARATGTHKDSYSKKERVIFYIHGGAYYLSSAAAQRVISIPLAKNTDSRVFAIDYRLAPETTFPGPLHDVVVAYLRLVEDLGIPSESIIVSGDSAGGGLSLALLMYLRDNNYPMPSGAILLSPWVDLTCSCESWDTNALFDFIPLPSTGYHMNPIGLYLGDKAEEYLTHPYVSPLFGNFEGLPPLLIQAGDAERLRDEIKLLAQKATLSGVEVRHELYEDAIHAFQLFPFLDSSKRSYQAMKTFALDFLPSHQVRSSQVLTDKEVEYGMDDGILLVRGDGSDEASGIMAVEEAVSTHDPVRNAGGKHSAGWERSRVLPNLSDLQESLKPSPSVSLNKKTSNIPIRDILPSQSSSSHPGPRRIRSAYSPVPPTERGRSRSRRNSHHIRFSMLI